LKNLPKKRQTVDLLRKSTTKQTWKKLGHNLGKIMENHGKNSAGALLERMESGLLST
jgi:hypothetical protein